MKKQRLHKEDRHELLYRQGFCLSALKLPAITHDYLDSVDKGDFFCPKFEDVKIRGCYRPPPKTEIFTEIQKLLAEHQMNLGISDQSRVSKEWLLLILSSIAPDHAIFSPDYYPPKKEPRPQETEQLTDLEMNFLYKDPKKTLAVRDKQIVNLMAKMETMEKLMAKMTISETDGSTK